MSGGNKGSQSLNRAKGAHLRVGCGPVGVSELTCSEGGICEGRWPMWDVRAQVG